MGKGITMKKSVESTKYVDIDIHPNILITFFHGIVWRQCIEQQLDGQDCPLVEEDLEPSIKDKLIYLANAVIRDAKTGKAYA